MKYNKSLRFATFLTTAVILVTCAESDFDFEYDSFKEGPLALSDEGRHVLLDHQGVPYLRITFDNKADCHRYGLKKIDINKNEMELFSQDLIIDLNEQDYDFPFYEYIMVCFYDYETEEILDTYIKY